MAQTPALPTVEDLNREIDEIFALGGVVPFCHSRYAHATCVHRNGHDGDHHTIGLSGGVVRW
jgi:hypothetical protein